MKMGQSTASVGRYGCTITSIAMGSQFYPPYRDPAFLAQNLRFTTDGLLLWSSLPTCTSFSLETRFFGRRDDIIQAALAHPKKIVLLQVENYHWVLGLGKNLFGGYTIADPWTAEKIRLFSRYKTITGGAVLSVKEKGV